MAGKRGKSGSSQPNIVNRQARHDYHILETIEAGLVLQGSEVKSIRLGQVSLREGYAGIERGEAFLYNVHIAPYEQANRFNHDPLRKRKLLLHKQEINRLIGTMREKGVTLVPLRMYFSRGRAKVELGVAKGKKQYDKRHDIAKRDAERDIQRALRDRERGA